MTDVYLDLPSALDYESEEYLVLGNVRGNISYDAPANIHIRTGVPSQLVDQIIVPNNYWYFNNWYYGVNRYGELEDATTYDADGLYGLPSLYVPGEDGAALFSLHQINGGPLEGATTQYSTQDENGYPIQLPSPNLITTYPVSSQLQGARNNQQVWVPYYPEDPELADYGDWVITGRIQVTNFLPPPQSSNPNIVETVIAAHLSGARNRVDYSQPHNISPYLDTITGRYELAVSGYTALQLLINPNLPYSAKSMGDGVTLNASIFYGTVPASGDVIEDTANATLFSRALVWTPAEYFSLWNVSPAPARPAGNQQIKPSVYERLIPTVPNLDPSKATATYSYFEYSANKTAHFAKMFAEEDFYERIQYQFVNYSFGTVLSPKQKTLWVWNAFREERELENIDLINFDGIFLSGDLTPDKYTPLKQKTYTIDAGIDGPEFIEAILGFDWDGGVYNEVLLTGRRVIVWSWKPDWSRPISERLEWKTDVITSYKGQEQRRALRRAPRRFAEFYTGAVEPNDRRIMETAIFGWGSKNWALPIWWDGREITQEVPLGAFTIFADTVYADFQAGLPALLYTDSLHYEAVDISQVFTDRITIVTPTIQSWPAGTILYPIRSAKIDGSVAVERWDGAASFERIRFNFERAAAYAESQGSASHNGYPVLELAPNWVEAPQLTYDRKTMIFDPQVGRRSYEDESGVPFMTQSQRYTFLTKQESDSWRKYIYAMRGSQRAMYVPTWTSDLQVVSVIEANALAIDAQHTNRTLLVGQAAGRRNIRIKLTSGQVFYRAITGSSELNDSTERFNISQAFGIRIQPSEIALVSYMSLSRFDSDAFEFAWWSGDVCDVSVALRSFNHGV